MNKLKSIWQIEDLRKKILFTLLLILVFRLGCSIPVPFVSNTALDSMFSNDSIFGYMNMLSGGALSRCAFFALGVSPYINSSIITQLLCVALPSWEALQKRNNWKRQTRRVHQTNCSGNGCNHEHRLLLRAPQLRSS